MDKSDNDEMAEKHYEECIGYGNPPKHTRWEKGYCPNPFGRPKKNRTRKHFLEIVAFRKLSITDAGRRRHSTVLEAIVLIIKNKAVAGNVSASRFYDNLKNISEYNETPAPRGVLICPEKMTVEEWVAAVPDLIAESQRNVLFATALASSATSQTAASDRTREIEIED